ncbi:hypothetical protein PtrV1_12689 [Pyrenophora tritici-repentis]|uniref:Uncharacterized protein n=1 Tax=Pyrenophora tritici-repentis TaxID=45151 RepID=A0A5M9KUX2_9PLEO|nr:hypothetical protein PtrV1_12689 [Pyrenophora tritici-repentis]KAF7565783.1 hypothetical protein PtrM4_052170 [Pyrenophora tritici-repentis]KAI0583562.1 hypothetical protein Alg215_03529 [Pyrenophora tritici-repentis]
MCYTIFLHFASISLAAGGLIHVPLSLTTPPAILRRQDSASYAASDFITVG